MDQTTISQETQPQPVQLKAVGLKKAYKGRLVVNDISIHVSAGEVVGLLGPNGAGKTTCFTMIAGLIQPTSGQVILENMDLTQAPMHVRSRHGIGYLPQEASVFRGMTAEQNILAALELNVDDHEKRRERLEELLAEFSIEHLRHANSQTLSGGERRRVEIARALAASPKFILLDEPLAGIDPIAVGDIRELIRHLKDRGIGVLITDHNVRDTLEIVDRAYIIAEGKVLMDGLPEEVVAHEGVRRIYLGDTFTTPLIES